MGRIYATEDGIDPAIAEAIYEHWLPRHAGDELPQSKPGILLSLWPIKLDSLVGLIGVGGTMQLHQRIHSACAVRRWV